MIVTRTPLRVSLFGGGSDIPEFWCHHTGAVLSFTIDKFIHIALQSVTPNHVKVMYSKVEQVWDVAKLRHDLFRACLERYNVLGNVEIASFADIPTKGSGLGSSSTFTVGLLNALSAYTNETLRTDQLADAACYVELVNCRRKIGHQDAYAAAFGGGNLFKFYPLTFAHVYSAPWGTLDENLILVNTGATRDAAKILHAQVENLEKKSRKTLNATVKMAEQADKAWKLLQQKKYDDIGDMLNDAWALKKIASPNATLPAIDALYKKIKKEGAIGAKLLGAGGGGYFLCYVPKAKQAHFNDTFHRQLLSFKFTNARSTVVFNDELIRS